MSTATVPAGAPSLNPVVETQQLAPALLCCKAMNEVSGHSELCYLDAADVRGAFPAWDNVELRNDEDGAIGRLDGIVIDPAARHVQFFVVSAGGAFRRHQYLVPFLPTRLDVEHQVLCVDMHKTELKRCEKFDPGSFHRYSDDDLLASLFPVFGEDERDSGEDEPQLN